MSKRSAITSSYVSFFPSSNLLFLFYRPIELYSNRPNDYNLDILYYKSELPLPKTLNKSSANIKFNESKVVKNKGKNVASKSKEEAIAIPSK